MSERSGRKAEEVEEHGQHLSRALKSRKGFRVRGLAFRGLGFRNLHVSTQLTLGRLIWGFPKTSDPVSGGAYNPLFMGTHIDSRHSPELRVWTSEGFLSLCRFRALECRD